MNIPDPPSPSMMVGYLVTVALSALLACWLLRRNRSHWPVVLCLALLALLFGVAFDKSLPDDSFITYRYALNLLQGHGFVYNTTERVLSTTTPLYALILALFGVFWPDLPFTSHAVSVAALFGGALVLYLLCYRHGRALVGLFLATLFMFNPLTVQVFSSESILHILLIFGALYAYDARRLNWAAFCAGLAVINRGDGALVMIAIGLHWALTRLLDPKRRGELRLNRLPWGAVLVYAATTLPWYLFSWLYFGSPAPATLAAKMEQKGAAGTQVFWEGLGVWWHAYSSASVFYWLIPPLSLVALLVVVWRRQELWTVPTLIWAALYVAGYTALQVPRYQNYYTPLPPVLFLLSVLGAFWFGKFAAARLPLIVKRIRRIPQARAAQVSVLLAGALLLAAMWPSEVGVLKAQPGWRPAIYKSIGSWLNQNTPADASIGMVEVGIIGYYANRHVYDFYGLIQPDVAERLGHNDQTYGVRHYEPDYVVILPWTIAVWHNTDQDIDAWFVARYQPVQTFVDPTQGTFTIYKRMAPPDGA